MDLDAVAAPAVARIRELEPRVIAILAAGRFAARDLATCVADGTLERHLGFPVDWRCLSPSGA